MFVQQSFILKFVIQVIRSTFFAMKQTNAKAQALAGGLAGHSAGRDARNAKPGRQQDDDT